MDWGAAGRSGWSTPGRAGALGGLSHLGRVVYLFLASAGIRLLGLVLGFASAPFYGVALVDQQIAAGILMVPGVLTDLIVLTVCLYLWLADDPRRPAGHQPVARSAGW